MVRTEATSTAIALPPHLIPEFIHSRNLAKGSSFVSWVFSRSLRVKGLYTLREKALHIIWAPIGPRPALAAHLSTGARGQARATPETQVSFLERAERAASPRVHEESEECRIQRAQVAPVYDACFSAPVCAAPLPWRPHGRMGSVPIHTWHGRHTYAWTARAPHCQPGISLAAPIRLAAPLMTVS